MSHIDPSWEAATSRNPSRGMVGSASRSTAPENLKDDEIFDPVELPDREVEIEPEDEDKLLDEEEIRQAIYANSENIEEMKKIARSMTPEELFKTFNTAGTGLISFDEFRKMLPALGFDLTSAKAFRFFNLCDTDGSGDIDIDEFKVALYTCDPTNGNPVGYVPSKFLSPLDAFETFDEAKLGLLDEDEFHFAIRYLGIELSDGQEETIFERCDYNHTGTIDYEEFLQLYLSSCDVKKELEDRGIDVPLLSKRSVLEDILLEILQEEESRERRALQEAKRYKKWMQLVKEKRKLLQRAQWRAYNELRSAMDAAGQVYVFGNGTRNQFSSNSNTSSLNKKSAENMNFDMFEQLLKVWEDRVHPEQLINTLRLQRRAEDQEEARQAKLRSDAAAAEKDGIGGGGGKEAKDAENDDTGFVGAIGPAKIDFDAHRKLIDPFREAMKSKFRGLNVAINTAALWGRRVHHVAISDNVMFALADTGEIYSWGGHNHWWNELQPDSVYQKKWRGDTTPRSQLLLGTVGRINEINPLVENDSEEPTENSEEDHKCEVIKTLARYFNVWESPLGSVPRLQYFEKDLLPKIKYDDIVHGMECRGKEILEATKIDLINAFYDDIILEKKLLGERTHKAIREIESQVTTLRRRRKFKQAEKMRARIEELWMPLLEVQVE
eukprot:gene5267-10537_t